MLARYYTIHVKRCIPNLKISLPIIAGEVSTTFLMLSDTLMIAYYDPTALAGASLANSIFYIFILISSGIAIGLKPIVTQLYIQGHYREASVFLKHGLLIAFLLGWLVYYFFYSCSFLFFYLGQPLEVMTLAIPYLKILSASAVFCFLYEVLAQFLESLFLTKVTMYIIFLGNIINISLNFVFIFGNFGFAEMGVEGAAWGTLGARVGMLVCGILYFFTRKGLAIYFFYRIRPQFEVFRQIMRNGILIGLQFIAESLAFTLGGIMVGWLGTTAIIAHRIAMNVWDITSMISHGLSQGTTIITAEELGRKKFHSLLVQGNNAIYMISFFMFLLGICIWLGSAYIPHLYLNDDKVKNTKEIADITSVLLSVVAIAQILDGIQIVALGALRGIQDIKVPSAVTFFVHWVVGLPLSYIFAFHFQLGIYGIWFGLSAGLGVVAILLTIRFKIIGKMMIRKQTLLKIREMRNQKIKTNV